MRSRNFGVCHGCRSTEHFFSDCPVKRPCPWCAHGLQKCFEVERTNNKGRLFKTCSRNCGYFDWVKKEESFGESSVITEAVNVADIEEIEDLPTTFDRLARIAERRDVEVSVTVTFRKVKGSVGVNGKGKEKA